MSIITCDCCGIVLDNSNTSSASMEKELCQECYHDKVEALGWERL